MKGAGLVLGILLAFFLAALGLWNMVGGLVEEAGVRAEDAVTLDVTFRLVDAGGQGISDAPVRLVFGASPERQPVSAGTSFATAGDGSFGFETTAPMDRRPRKVSANFFSGLFARPEATNHLAIGAELDYMAYRWLYVADLFRFQESGDLVLDGLRIFSRDERGRFSHEARRSDGGWDMPDLEGMRLTTPGNEITATLAPKADVAAAWTLSLTVTRQPPPAVR